MSFSVSGSDFFESGRNPSDSLVQGLKALVVALKMWSTKGEVSITLHGPGCSRGLDNTIHQINHYPLDK